MRKLKVKEDKKSNFMADFDPTTSRREKQKLTKKIYVAKNAKSNLYDSKVKFSVYRRLVNVVCDGVSDPDLPRTAV